MKKDEAVSVPDGFKKFVPFVINTRSGKRLPQTAAEDHPDAERRAGGTAARHRRPGFNSCGSGRERTDPRG